MIDRSPKQFQLQFVHLELGLDKSTTRQSPPAVLNNPISLT